MKTLLVNPHQPTKGSIAHFVKPYPPVIPLGLAYVAAALEKSGNEVVVLDNVIEKLDLQQLRSFVSQQNPKVVGITVGTFYYDSAKEVADVVKSVDPAIKVVVGGPHPSLWPERTLGFESFDYAVRGEGEETSIELWNLFNKVGGGAEVNADELAKIKGIAFKKSDAATGQPRIFVNEARPPIRDLDSLPWPARHLFPMNKYDKHVAQIPVTPVESVSTSRGCPFNCRFCTTHMVFGRGFRGRSGKSVGDELEFLASEYGARGVCFREDEFTINKQRVLDICAEIKKRKLDLQWLCESRVDTIDEEMTRAMRGAGCCTIWFGMESGRQDTLDFINKRITLEQSKKAVQACKKAGIRCGGSFILGLPNENFEMMQETVDFAKNVGIDFAWFNIFKAFPASAFYEYVEKHGMIDKIVGEGLALIKTPLFDYEKMLKIQAKAQRQFYSSPKRLLDALVLHVKSGDLTLQQITGGVKFFVNSSLHPASDEFID